MIIQKKTQVELLLGCLRLYARGYYLTKVPKERLAKINELHQRSFRATLLQYLVHFKSTIAWNQQNACACMHIILWNTSKANADSGISIAWSKHGGPMESFWPKI